MAIPLGSRWRYPPVTVGFPSTFAWENRLTGPVPTGTPWARELYRPSPEERQTIGPKARIRVDGDYTIELHYPANLGTRAMDSLVDALRAQFESGTVLTASGQYVTVRSTSRGAASEAGGDYRVPVTIRWSTYVYNSV